MSRQKIQKAAKATDAIQEHVGKALGLLDRFNGRIVNGWGIYSDAPRQRLALRVALEALKEAEQVMTATAWPEEKDYPEE